MPVSIETSLVRPTPQQLEWQQAGLTMFFHFGVNTFTDREWGDGKESPAQFAPKALDVRQWVRASKAAGFRYAILTAKHHDGFCLWPSRFTEHSVKNSPWRDGKGDVVREFSDACRAEGMKMGLYLSPWDRNSPLYGTPLYNRYYVDQLTELMTRYGDVAEVWLDGANGEGPNGKKQEYDFEAFYRMVRRHQPKALIAVCGPDIRWVGNENGLAAETEWSVQKPHPVRHKGAKGKVWWPAECDTSIRPGWFWHRKEDDKVKSLAKLMEIYYSSVGRNSVLLLNVPPNDTGLLSAPDLRRLEEFRAERERVFANDLARSALAQASSSSDEQRSGPASAISGNADTYWEPHPDDTSSTLTLLWRTPITFGLSSLQEHIADGQHIGEYRIEAFTDTGWNPVVSGTTVGCRKIDRFPAVTASRVRITILKSDGAPRLSRVSLFAPPEQSAAG